MTRAQVNILSGGLAAFGLLIGLLVGSLMIKYHYLPVFYREYQICLIGGFGFVIGLSAGAAQLPDLVATSVWRHLCLSHALLCVGWWFINWAFQPGRDSVCAMLAIFATAGSVTMFYAWMAYNENTGPAHDNCRR